MTIAATAEGGRTAPGRRADLVLLRADPLADIDALGQIAAVVADGRLWTGFSPTRAAAPGSDPGL